MSMPPGSPTPFDELDKMVAEVQQHKSSNRRTNAQRCFQNCADYACARAGQCTGAGKLEDEAVTRASKQKVVAEVMRMADDAIKVLPPASQCPACGSRQCISWNSMNQDGLQNNEPSLHGGFGTTGQEPSSVQSPDETAGDDARDAARYRFLRQPNNAIVYAKDRNAWSKNASGHVRYDTAEQLDAAVDAARGAEEPTTRQPERPVAWYRWGGSALRPIIAWGDWPPPERDDTAWYPLYRGLSAKIERECLPKNSEQRECKCASYCMVAAGAKSDPPVKCRGLTGEDPGAHMRFPRR